jgi:ATF/CREB family transcription factor
MAALAPPLSSPLPLPYVRPSHASSAPPAPFAVPHASSSRSPSVASPRAAAAPRHRSALPALSRPAPTPLSRPLVSAPAAGASRRARATTRRADPVAGPSRPAARPGTRSSRHHLEPNPFEKSFSSKPPGESPSPEADEPADDAAPAGGKKAKGAAAAKKGAAAARAAKAKGSDGGSLLGQPPGDAPQEAPRLPSLAALTSPAADAHPHAYPWSGGLGSLRAGPLSPAMLAGPAASGVAAPSGGAFDASAFRTGFTPDLSNFKTGLTPLGGPSSFPPPSPGTAAFLAMITHGSGAGLTPGTLSALAGPPHDAAGAPMPPREGNAFALAFQKSMGNGTGASQPPQPQTSRLRMTTDEAENGTAPQDGKAKNGTTSPQNARNKPLPNNTSPKRAGGSKTKRSGAGAGVPSQPAPAAQQPLGPPHVPSQHAPQGMPGNVPPAASGLFLLSQAHQELTKREDEAAAAAASTSKPKRKKSENGSVNGAPAGAAGANAKRAKKQKTPRSEAGSDKYPGMESDEERDFDKETEGMDDEEKRKNFLERNRQGEHCAVRPASSSPRTDILLLPQRHSSAGSAKRPGCSSCSSAPRCCRRTTSTCATASARCAARWRSSSRSSWPRRRSWRAAPTAVRRRQAPCTTCVGHRPWARCRRASCRRRACTWGTSCRRRRRARTRRTPCRAPRTCRRRARRTTAPPWHTTWRRAASSSSRRHEECSRSSTHAQDVLQPHRRACPLP